MALAEQRLRELPDDPRPTEAGERIVALERRDDGTRGELGCRPVMIGHHNVEPERARMLDLGYRGDPAVDRDDEVEALRCEAREGVGVQAVAFLEPRREMPCHVGVHLAQKEDCQGGRADPVGVVVAVDADPLAGRDCGGDRVDCGAHVAERERIVAGEGPSRNAACLVGVSEAAPDEHRRGRLVE